MVLDDDGGLPAVRDSLFPCNGADVVELGDPQARRDCRVHRRGRSPSPSLEVVGQRGRSLGLEEAHGGQDCGTLGSLGRRGSPVRPKGRRQNLERVNSTGVLRPQKRQLFVRGLAYLI